MRESATPNQCLNCGTALVGNFCSHCGQASNTSTITFKETFSQFLSSIFSLEGKLPFTIGALVKNPGKVFREYLAGKRASYYKPVPFFILLTAIYLIVQSLIGYDPLAGQFDAKVSEDAPELMKRIKTAARFMVEHINNILFLLVLSIGLLFKSFYRKRYKLAEYTAVGFYIAGIYVLLGLISILVIQFTSFTNPGTVPMFLLFAYLYYASATFFQNRNFGAWIKYFFLSLFCAYLYVIMAFALAYVWVSYL
jgi:hypothetical protein